MAGSACTSACVAFVPFHAGMLGLSERCECLACQCSTLHVSEALRVTLRNPRSLLL